MMKKKQKDNRRKILIGSDKIYKDFIKIIAKKGKIQYSTWSLYMKIISKTIIEYLLQGKILYLPYDLGMFYIEKRETEPYIIKNKFGEDIPNYKKINLQATKLKRQQLYPDKDKSWFRQPENRFKGIVFIKEIHSDYMFRFVWENKKKDKFLKDTHLKLWSFRFSSTNKKILHNYIKNNKQLPSYYEKHYNTNNTRIYREEAPRECTDVKRGNSREHMESNEIDRFKTRSGIFFNFGNTGLQS